MWSLPGNNGPISVSDWVGPLEKIKSRVLLSLVGLFTCWDQPPMTSWLRNSKYLGGPWGQVDQDISGRLKSPTTSLMGEMEHETSEMRLVRSSILDKEDEGGLYRQPSNRFGVVCKVLIQTDS